MQPVNDLYSFAIRERLYGQYKSYHITLSNKELFTPHEYKIEPDFTEGVGWYKGYSFRHFWSNCCALLGGSGALDGMQQLCHHYYLNNGSVNAKSTVNRIKIFLGIKNE